MEPSTKRGVCSDSVVPYFGWPSILLKLLGSTIKELRSLSHLGWVETERMLLFSEI